MNGLELFLDPSLARRLGWMLVHSIWEGVLIGGAFATLRFALRGRSANLRYVAGSLCLALMLGAPAATVLMWDTAEGPSATAPAAAAGQPAPAPAQPPESGGIPDFGNHAGSFVERTAELISGLAPWLASFWLAGVGLCSVRLARAYRWTRQLRVSDYDIPDSALMAVLGDLRLRLGISRPVRLVHTAMVAVPTVIGWVRPLILLPAATLAGLTPGQVEALLAHELAHVRRWDYLVNACQCLLETLMFYHPVVWWISRCVREEREHCCDDLAVRACGSPLAYARALAALEESRAGAPDFALGATGGSLLHRIWRLLGLTTFAPANPWQMTGLTLLGIGLGLIALGIFLWTGPVAYCAEALVRLSLHSEDDSRSSGKTVWLGNAARSIEHESETIKSAEVLRPALESLGLNQEPHGKSGTGNPSTNEEAVARLRTALDVRQLRGTSLLEIRALGDTPEEAAQIANAVAYAYRNYRHDQRALSMRDAIQSLRRQFDEQNHRVREARKKLADLRDRLGIPDALAQRDEPIPLMSAETLRKLKELEIESEFHYVQQRALLDQLANLPEDQLARTLETTSEDANLTSLLEQRDLVDQKLVVASRAFGKKNPEVNDTEAQLADLNNKIQDRVNGILRGLKTKIEAIKMGLDELKKDIESARKADLQMASKGRPYYTAKRELESLEEAQNALQLKLLTGKVDSPRPALTEVEIVNPAVPPFTPTVRHSLRGTALICLGLLLDTLGLLLLVRLNPEMSALAGQTSGSVRSKPPAMANTSPS